MSLSKVVEYSTTAECMVSACAEILFGVNQSHELLHQKLNCKTNLTTDADELNC